MDMKDTQMAEQRTTQQGVIAMSSQKSVSGYGAPTVCLTSFLNDAGYRRTIKITRQGRKHRLSILNTQRAVIAYKDHASFAAARAGARELVTLGSAI